MGNDHNPDQYNNCFAPTLIISPSAKKHVLPNHEGVHFVTQKKLKINTNHVCPSRQYTKVQKV